MDLINCKLIYNQIKFNYIDHTGEACKFHFKASYIKLEKIQDRERES